MDLLDPIIAKLTPVLADAIRQEIPRVVEQMLRDGVTVTVNGIVVTVKTTAARIASEEDIHGA